VHTPLTSAALRRAQAETDVHVIAKHQHEGLVADLLLAAPHGVSKPLLSVLHDKRHPFTDFQDLRSVVLLILGQLREIGRRDGLLKETFKRVQVVLLHHNQDPLDAGLTNDGQSAENRIVSRQPPLISSFCEVALVRKKHGEC
jgi:hypothetical protein